jgi:hypothetical protein
MEEYRETSTLQVNVIEFHSATLDDVAAAQPSPTSIKILVRFGGQNMVIG